MRRALSVLRLLHKGSVTFDGDNARTVTVEVNTDRSYSWTHVEQACEAALEDGRGWAVVDASDVLWALRSDQDDIDPPVEVREVADRFRSGCVGLNSRMLEEPNPFVPPPLVWPVSQAVRWALFERDVRIVHVIDLDWFLQVEAPEGRIIDVRSNGDFLEDFCFVVDVGGSPQHVSKRFLDDVLYGFETIESAARLIISFAARCAHLAELDERGELGDEESTVAPQDVVLVSNMDEARRLAEDNASPKRYGYVAMPKELYDDLERRSRELFEE